ncbi:MAG TPA: 50S ribosomal protein L35 [Chitinophagales bacterium]|nr:50S ribosomal protein L35 [Chitinophagales bacterium]
MLTKKSHTRKNRLGNAGLVSDADSNNIKRLLAI